MKIVWSNILFVKLHFFVRTFFWHLLFLYKLGFVNRCYQIWNIISKSCMVQANCYTGVRRCSSKPDIQPANNVSIALEQELMTKVINIDHIKELYIDQNQIFFLFWQHIDLYQRCTLYSFTFISLVTKKRKNTRSCNCLKILNCLYILHVFTSSFLS